MKRNTVILKILSVMVLILSLTVAVNSADLQSFDRDTRLAVAAKVWGFLKYYHPVASNGETDMDALLVEFMPLIKTADTEEAFNEVIQDMIFETGPINMFGLPHSLEEVPMLDWIDETPHLDALTVRLLKRIKRLHLPGDSYYVTYFNVLVRNTAFSLEKKYEELGNYPPEPYRLIALFRFWNIIEYFFPYKHIIGEDWNNVLVEYIPRMINAGNAEAYHLAVREFSARIKDSHAFMTSEVMSDYWGRYYLPVFLSHVEGQTVVRSMRIDMDLGDDIRVGDVIMSIDGVPTEILRQDMRKYIHASNEPTLQRNIINYLRRGHDDSVTVTVERADGYHTLTLKRYLPDDFPESPEPTEYSKWHIMDNNIGYVNMGLLESEDVEAAMTQLKNTRAIVFDIRNYPNFILYDLGEYLNPEKRDFVLIDRPDLMYPGKFDMDENCLQVGPTASNSDYYKGKVIVLFNEQTQSSAEFHCMAFQTAPNVTCIGSQTAGADGNVSNFDLPGGIQLVFTGIGIYYPDGTPTQRVGIVPDIYMEPTINGMREGRDELMEKALEIAMQ